MSYLENFRPDANKQMGELHMFGVEFDLIPNGKYHLHPNLGREITIVIPLPQCQTNNEALADELELLLDLILREAEEERKLGLDLNHMVLKLNGQYTVLCSFVRLQPQIYNRRKLQQQERKGMRPFFDVGHENIFLLGPHFDFDPIWEEPIIWDEDDD